MKIQVTRVSNKNCNVRLELKKNRRTGNGRRSAPEGTLAHLNAMSDAGRERLRILPSF